jgi:hypothetical protein
MLVNNEVEVVRQWRLILIDPVGCQNCATSLDLAFHAACWYSLMRAPRTGRRLIRSPDEVSYGRSAEAGGASSASRCCLAALAVALAVLRNRSREPDRQQLASPPARPGSRRVRLGL